MPAIAVKVSVFSPTPPLYTPILAPLTGISILSQFSRTPRNFFLFSASRKTNFRSKSSEESAGISEEEDEWLQKLPDKKKSLYSHSLPCVEAWLRSLGFQRSRDDRAVWFVENRDWHAQLSLDVTDLYIRYLKNGPGNLDKDIERRFSYALNREDIENAVLGGP